MNNIYTTAYKLGALSAKDSNEEVEHLKELLFDLCKEVEELQILNADTKGKVLIPTGDRINPFALKIEKDKYLLVKTDGTLSGDGFSEQSMLTYFPKVELENEIYINKLKKCTK